jgi:hypothetical protein
MQQLLYLPKEDPNLPTVFAGFAIRVYGPWQLAGESQVDKCKPLLLSNTD